MKRLMASLILLSVPATASAAGWTSSESRGVELHTLTTSEVSVRLICDPHGSYDENQNYIQVEARGGPVNGAVTFSAEGKSVDLSFIEGTAFEADTTDSDWLNVLQILSTDDEFTLTTGKQGWKVRPGAKLSHGCNS